MTRLEFLQSLHDKLSILPKEDTEERLGFYSEMIEDRMEEGLSEEAAVLTSRKAAAYMKNCFVRGEAAR